MDPLTVTLALAVLGVLVVVAASALGERLGVAAPLLLVGAGVAASVVPGFPTFEVEPEWVLAGLLPPLLYSAAVSVPAMDLRRELSAVSGLSVVLVVLSSFALGGFFALVVPGLGLAWGVALGAVVSPTDAVATSIARRLGVPARAVTILDGEGLLNDATALVVLRAGIAAAASGVSLWGVAGRFVWSIALAALIGVLVGRAGLWVRARLREVPATTALSFAVPFVAAIPAELAGASGLVAAVLAGLTTGWRAPRVLSPGARLSDAQNWSTVEMLLEGAVFLVMGLQLIGILRDVQADHAGVGTALAVAAGALALTVVVRAVYVTLLFLGQRTRTARTAQRRDVFARLDAGEDVGHRRRQRRTPTERQVQQFRSRVARALADIDHLLAHPLDARQGAVVVWAGMRGAITLAAAQTLPEETPARPLLLLVAVAVAVGSLLLQGATLPWVVRRLLGSSAADPADQEQQWDVVRQRLAEAAAGAGTDDPVAVLRAQRTALLAERDLGRLDSAVLTAALAELDADQIALEVRSRGG
ncbi:sodium/proton antiporter, CPA1 family [Klenkia soli]|uniref:Sodium/proton antiporter, CPA1 family n=1 Tax=Klenkia soli TaxID=1052260 RepID=A0A1H0QI48_9ACTN|nr:cation:proton antiporter [Klenkia soli]SDP17002.1 sodium/proton antiporter, CPA1 family [Klenkia soli]